MLFFVVLLRLPRCGGASAHLEKYWFSLGEYCKFRLSAVFARNEKRTNSMRNLSEKQLENTSKKACRKACRKHAIIIKKSSKIHPKFDPGGLRRPLASQLGAWSLPKLLPEPSGASKKLYDRAWGRPGAPLEPFFIEKKIRHGRIAPQPRPPFPPHTPPLGGKPPKDTSIWILESL